MRIKQPGRSVIFRAGLDAENHTLFNPATTNARFIASDEATGMRQFFF
jgi:hypothetical protein